ncbi:aminoglycoside adenylyltransferase domain-containing protein [Microbacterium sp. NPDC091313]
MMPSATGIARLDAVLARVVANAAEVYGTELVGVYLEGSFALGGADEESDCDAVIVVARGTSVEQLARLRDAHRALAAHDPWARRLELSYAPAAELADIAATGRAWPYLDHGSDRLELEAHGDTLVTRWVLHHCGIALTGAPPASVAPDVPVPRMRADAAARIARSAGIWREGFAWDAWGQRYAVLTMARLLRTARRGDVVSKPEAVAWARGVLDPGWHDLVTTALAERGQRPWDAPISDALARRTEAFVAHVAGLAGSG